MRIKEIRSVPSTSGGFGYATQTKIHDVPDGTVLTPRQTEVDPATTTQDWTAPADIFADQGRPVKLTFTGED